VKAPLDGVILEKNIAVGDIVDTSLDLFKVADLTSLGVMVHVYEEDLPTLRALGAGPPLEDFPHAQPQSQGIDARLK